MNKVSKSLFKEIFSLDIHENTDTENDNKENAELSEEESIEVLFQGNPSYPRIFWGESAKPLVNGPFPESEYMDDNIHTTYKGLISYLG